MSGGDMSAETKDPAIKLFGKTIPLPESQIPAKSIEKFDPGCQILDKSELMDACSEMTKTEAEDPRAEETGKVDKSSALEDSKEKDHQTPLQVNEVQVNHKPKEDRAETNGMGPEKVLKKPDKVLPCPRCNSLDTKFCYFNNYNVNQPRHFCKNCQRYWTAGGTMRNVPVGAGRRKNKHLASQYRQIMASSEGVPATSVETQDSANPQVLSCGDSSTSFRSSTGNGTVLKFGPEAPLCESMVTVLHLRDQKRCAKMGSVNCGENGEEPSSSGSSMTASSFRDNELAENVMQKEGAGFPRSYNEIPLPQPLHCYPVPPWVFPCNPSWNSSVASMAASRCSSELVYVPDSSNPNPVQWCSTPMVAGPGFCPPSIPLQFVPASYWGCMPVWAAGTGNVAFAGSNGCLSLSSSQNNSCSGNGSPTLGKHSRDENLIDEEKSDKGIVVPKTLRIDDPDEASKSSIWATLGIKHGRKEILSKGGIFKSFAKAEDKGHGSDATQVLEANPAALSRSHTFQEST